jgi:hypothetical protein
MSDAIQQLLDRQQCTDLAAIYCRALDRLDPDLLRSVYFDDAVESRGFYEGGPDGFVTFAMNTLSAHDANQHMLGQSLIEVDDDVAHGEHYFIAFHRTTANNGDKEDFWVGGRYIDRYEKRDGIWKIAFRSEVNDWTSTKPAADNFFFIRNPTAIKGGRGAQDIINKPKKYKKVL